MGSNLNNIINIELITVKSIISFTFVKVRSFNSVNSVPHFMNTSRKKYVRIISVFTIVVIAAVVTITAVVSVVVIIVAAIIVIVVIIVVKNGVCVERPCCSSSHVKSSVIYNWKAAFTPMRLRRVERGRVRVWDKGKGVKI